jgi:small subunit ribosomal protein S1
MQEKNYDPFFEEETEGKGAEDQLLNMLDSYDKPAAQLTKGSKVKGTVSRVGSEHIFVDIKSRTDAMISITEFTDEQGVVTVKPGDTIEAILASQSDGEIILTKSMSSLSSDQGDLIAAMKSRMPVQGKVTGINKGGLQVKVLGKQAFCPVSQVELRFVEDVNPYLGRTMSFIIDRVTEGGRTIVLTRIPLLEQDMEVSLDELALKAPTKAVVRGTVTRITDFGLFVQLTGGMEGLVHVSEVSWLRSENLAESYTIGQQVDVAILGVEKRSPLRSSKISLSIKQAGQDPWERIHETLSVGSAVEGTVTRLASFGAFIQIPPGVEGLIHVSEMSWIRRVNHPQDVVKVGDQVSVTILAIDTAKHSVSCSLKDVSKDPWQSVPQEFAVGSKVSGTIASQTKYGFFIELKEGVTGLLPLGAVPLDKKGSIKPGQQLEVSIAGIDMEQRRISLSLGGDNAAADDEAARAYLKEMKSQQEKQTQQSPASSVSEFAAALMSALKANKE